MIRSRHLVALLLVLSSSTALAQHSVGSISGTIREKLPAGQKTARILLLETTSRSVVQEARPDANGAFQLQDVPFARYILRLVLDTTVLAEQHVVVSSGVPIMVTIDSIRRVSGREVTVSAERDPLDRIKTGAHTFYTAADIAALPKASSEKGIEAVLLSTPGVVPDEDGRLHVRGEDAQLQYIIDGIPVTANMTRVYSSLFSANLIKTVDVQTGGLNAEYGRATSAVMAITTKSGFDRPFFIGASGSAGSFSTREAGLECGGNIGGWGGMYLAGSLSHSDRYLDPITSGDPIHDKGDAGHFFGKFDIVPASGFDIDLLGGYNHTLYQVPNMTVRTPAQDQQQDMNDYLFGARLNLELGENALLSVLGYTRHATAEFTSGGLSRISSAADSAQAVAENEKFFIGGKRTNDVRGAQAEYSACMGWMNLQHNVKVGVGGESYPLSEFFTFAVTNPNLSNPDSSGGDLRYRPYDITQGGHPFLVDRSQTGTSFFAYAQDQVAWDRWTVNVGIRYDVFDLLQRESGISPRLGVNYALNDDLVLFGSYNRIMMQAPVENVLVSSSNEARILTAEEQGTTPTSVQSETSHNLEVGASYRLNDNLTLDVSGYGKMIDNFIVKVELGNSGIIFPVNLKQGLVAGGELRLAMRDWNHFSGFLSVAAGTAMGLKPDDGSSPVAAGLILGEEGKNYSHPFAGEDAFNTEHNQLATAAMEISYQAPYGIFATLGGRFDSGLPFDLTDKNGNGLDAEQSRVELRRRGYSDDVIDLLSLESDMPGSPDKSGAPHVTFDLAAGIDLRALTGANARVTLTAINVLDTPYLYKFESSFGGTHFGTPRTLAIRIEAGL
ncbi:MAG TPA: TonB-dependent receptor [Candidatus Kapabacteria bacterium]|nr:TonB-dependent receptor [Candidatus Kapabacteria bacterium]